MPYFFDENLREQDRGENPNQSQSVQISGGSPTTDSTGNVAPKDNAPNKDTGSGFTNLDNYLNNNNASGFSDQVTGKVQNQIDSAKQSMGTASQDFTNQVSSANKIPSQSDINSAVANPSTANAQDYQNWENQTYSGPKNLAESQNDYNQYWGGIQGANTTTQNLGTDSGRFTLLDSYFGRPDYNFGDKSLDNYLLQQGLSGGKIQDLQNQAGQLNAQGAQGEQDLTNLASQQAGQVEQAKNAARAAVGIDQNGQVITTGTGIGAIGSLENQVQSNLDATNASRQAQVSQLQNDMAAGSQALSPQEQKLLGIDQSSWWGVNPLTYFTPHQDLTTADVMTPDQAARLSALENLAGVSNTAPVLSGNGADAGAALPFTFDNSAFGSAVSSAQDNYNRSYAAIQQPGAGGQSEVGSGVPSTGVPKLDVAALQSDINTRQNLGYPTEEAPYIAQDTAAIQALTQLMNEYGMNTTLLNHGSNFGPGPQIRPKAGG